MTKLSEAQKRANKKWNDKNKEKIKYYNYRSYSKKFVRDMATAADLKELQDMISDRLKELN